MTNQPTIWALKMQPNSAEDDATPYEFCKQHSPPIIGTGWGLSGEYPSEEAALDAHREQGNTDQYGNVQSPIRAMIEDAAIGDYVWVNEESEYGLCRIESDWQQHPNTADDEWTRNDIHNYREASWQVLDPALVPGYVKRYFAAPRVLTMAQPSGGKSDTAKRYATHLFEEAPTGVSEVVDLDAVSTLVEGSTNSEVFGLLDPDETEDLVLDYLQFQGWHIVKSSASRTQPGIECVLRRVETDPQIGYVQVKSGNASVDIDDYRDLTDNGTVFIHQFDMPDAELPGGLRWVSPTELRRYIVAHPGYLPTHTAFKLQLAL